MKRIQEGIIFILLSAIWLQPITMRAAQWDGYDLKQGKYERIDKLEKESYGSQDEWIQSGNFYYEFLDTQKEYITIRKIKSKAVKNGKLIIPEKIDGHSVLGIGVWNWFWEKALGLDGFFCVLDDPNTVRKIVLPKGLEYLGNNSFQGCQELTHIALPDSLVIIADSAFFGCVNIEEMEFPPGVYVPSGVFGSSYAMTFHPRKAVIYSDSLMGYMDSWFLPGDETELHIRRNKKDSYFLRPLPGYIKKLYVDKTLSKFQFELAYDENSNLLNYNIKKLIMNGKETELKLPKDVNKLPVPLLSNVYQNSAVKGLYTVKGAKAIKEVRKYKIPYYWKTAGKAKKVKAGKTNGRYAADWGKVKTILHKNEYKFSKKKSSWNWKKTKTPVKTIYKVYGKKKKNGSYKFIRETKKTTIKSKYKYIKAVPVKAWD